MLIRTLSSLLAVAALGLAGCTSTQPALPAPSHSLTVTQLAPVIASGQHHGIVASQQRQTLSTHVTIRKPDATMVDGDFVFELNGPRSRHDAADGSITVYDGSDCWVTPADQADPSDRFHVWTWPWFIIAPLKMLGDGVHLSDYKVLELDGKSYHTYLQTFGPEEGDAPDDWYRLFIDPVTNDLAAMAYVVSYGKAVDPSKPASIILYHDYQDVGGLRLASRYTFWYWTEADGLMGGAPKFTGTVSLFRLDDAAADAFTKPDGAVSVAVPTPAP